MQLSLRRSSSIGLVFALMLVGCDRRHLDIPPDAEPFWAIAIGEEDELKVDAYNRVTLLRPPLESLDLAGRRSLWFVEFASDPERYGLEPGGQIALVTCEPSESFQIRTLRVRRLDELGWVDSVLPPDRRCLPTVDVSRCWEQSLCATSIAGDGAACVDCSQESVRPPERPSADCPVDWVQHVSQLSPDVPERFSNCRPERWNAEAPACEGSRLTVDEGCAPAVLCDPNFEHVATNGRPVVAVASQADLDRAWQNLQPDSLVLISAPSVVIDQIPQDRIELAGVCPAQTEIVFATYIASKEVALTALSLRQPDTLQITDSIVVLRDVDWALADTVSAPPEIGVNLLRGRLEADGLRFSVSGVEAALRVESAEVAFTNSHFEGDAAGRMIIDTRTSSLAVSGTVFRVDKEVTTEILAVTATRARSLSLDEVDFRGVRRGLLVQESTADVFLQNVVGDFHTDDETEQPPALFAFYNVRQASIRGLFCQTLGATKEDNTSCVLVDRSHAEIRDLSTGRVGHGVEVGQDATVFINRMWSVDYLRAGIQIPEGTPQVMVTLQDAFMKAVFIEDVEANGNSVRGAVALRSNSDIRLSRVWVVSHGYHGVSARAGRIEFADLIVENGQASAISTQFGGAVVGVRLLVRNVRRGVQLQSSAPFNLEDVVIEPVTVVSSPDPSRLLDVNESDGIIKNFRFDGVTPERLDFSSPDTLFRNGVFRGAPLDTQYINNFPARFDNVGYEVTE